MKLRLRRSIWFVPFTCFLLHCGTASQSSEARRFAYPRAHQSAVVDSYHGTDVADPYRWLEDPTSAETIEWVAAQNRLTADYLNTPTRDRIKSRISDLMNHTRFTVPRKKGNRYFYFKNDGLQNQSVYYMQTSLSGAPEVVIDPNTFSEDGTIALSGMKLSEDGKYLAYMVSVGGSDQRDIKIRDIDSKRDLDEVLNWCMYSAVAWKKDSSGFFYNRFPTPGTVDDEDLSNFNRLYYHQLGTPQSSDELIYENPKEKELSFIPSISDDGKYLIVKVRRGTSQNAKILYRKVNAKGPFVRLIDTMEAKYGFIENIGTTFYFLTDLEASKGRIVAIDTTRPQKKHWKEIIPEQENPIHFATMAGGHLVVVYMQDAHDIPKVFTREGKFVGEIETPGLGAISTVRGKKDDPELFFGYRSYLTPDSSYRYDFTTQKTTAFRIPKIDFDASGYETKQVFFTSKDGTKVPMFLTHKKGLALNGRNPALLNGYGGFNQSWTPRFSVSVLVWIENGGVYAVANIRGGAEYGEKWHRAGMLENKQNVFDDFIAAGEWLIGNGYTDSSKLAIEGGSNGGLLTAACMVQRPELFGAVISDVPVIDMLRYHKLSVGRFWVPEYGNAEENPDHFKFLYAYSPLHNIKKGATFPPTLITTADTDDRVVPAHAKKFAATLQTADAGQNPILLRVETKAGHGGGKPIAKLIEARADDFSFLFKTFGMTLQ